MRLALRLVIGLVLLLVLAVGGVLYTLDRIVKNAVEESGTAALGVSTKLSAVDIDPVRGHLGLHGFEVANPSGFGPDPFFELRSVVVDVPPASLLDDVVVVPRLTLDGISVRLEGGRGGMNYKPILDHFSQGGSSGDSESGTTYLVRELVISDIHATLEISPAIRGVSSFEARIPELRLKDVGSESDGGVLLPELTQIVLKEVLAAVAKQRGDLPSQIVLTLQSRVRALPRTPGDLVGVAEQLGAAGLDEDVSAAKRVVDGDPEAIREGVGRLLKRFGQGGDE